MTEIRPRPRVDNDRVADCAELRDLDDEGLGSCRDEYPPGAGDVLSVVFPVSRPPLSRNWKLTAALPANPPTCRQFAVNMKKTYDEASTVVSGNVNRVVYTGTVTAVAKFTPSSRLTSGSRGRSASSSVSHSSPVAGTALARRNWPSLPTGRRWSTVSKV